MAEPRGSSATPGWVSVILSLARLLGSARLIAIQTVLVIVWIIANLVLQASYLGSHSAHCLSIVNTVRIADTALPGCSGAHPIDFYPFVLLNLLFSTLAAYATPIILFVQNRATREDRRVVLARRRVAEQQQQNVHFIARELADMRRILSAGLTESYASRSIEVFAADRRRRTSSIASRLSPGYAPDPAPEPAPEPLPWSTVSSAPPSGTPRPVHASHPRPAL